MGAKLLIRHEDFLSASIEVRLRNLVSDTLLEAGVKTLGIAPSSRHSDANLIQLLEISVAGLVLSVPAYTCAVGHVLEIELRVSRLTQKPFEVRLLGRVVQIEKTSDTQFRAAIELKSPAGDAWSALQRLLARRQEAISAFLAKVKGA